MCVYNEPVSVLNKSIESILAQTYSNFEFIIVVDNPNAADQIHLLQAKLNTNKNVKVIINDTNIGLVNSLNKGVSWAKGEFIARMDADDIAFSDRFELEMNFLKKNNFDFVSSIANIIDENDEILITRRKEKDIINQNIISKLLKIKNVTVHPTWLFKKSILKTIHEYRSVDSAEDYDFVGRVMEKKFKIGILGVPTLKYRFNEKSISRKNALRQFFVAKNVSNALKDMTLSETSPSDLNKINGKITKETESRFAEAIINGVSFKRNKNVHSLITFLVTVVSAKYLIYFSFSKYFSSLKRKIIIRKDVE
ncbi:glycosyltransferase family 2 protein [Dellaglioa algida]|nr:glycosyltransferase [Dellaglioa algida]MDK1719793.1 glycosyltransferase [Dellaglioa algida]MDK1722079.1 glycosyltransferase [Dellaglioa algida]MDK1723136.1 glycosyltransferase [Dellaglioa algida]